jgi:hypothetical protein
MPFGNRVWRIHVLVSVPVSRAQRGNGRYWNSKSIAPGPVQPRGCFIRIKAAGARHSRRSAAIASITRWLNCW